MKPGSKNLRLTKSIKKLKNIKYYVFEIKHYSSLVFVTSVEMKMKNIYKNKNQWEH